LPKAGSTRRCPQDRRGIRVVHRILLHHAADERRGDDAGLPSFRPAVLAGVVLVGAVITLNVALGGMKGITRAGLSILAQDVRHLVPIFC